MLLSDSAIRAALEAGHIEVDPFNPQHLGPNSYDLTLGSTVLTYTSRLLDARQENTTQATTIPEDGLVLLPDTLYLGHTVERAGACSLYAPMVEGRSSLGRLGLDVHISAGFGDVGFVGVWTLEMRVVHPLRIYPNMRICQVYFHRVEGAVTRPYNGKYQNSKTVEASKLYRELNK